MTRSPPADATRPWRLSAAESIVRQARAAETEGASEALRQLWNGEYACHLLEPLPRVRNRLRADEKRALRWTDLDFQTQTVRIDD